MLFVICNRRKIKLLVSCVQSTPVDNTRKRVWQYIEKEKERKLIGVRLLTGMDRNGPEWASITGMDLKIRPKIHVLSVLDKKFWLSNVKN